MGWLVGDRLVLVCRDVEAISSESGERLVVLCRGVEVARGESGTGHSGCSGEKRLLVESDIADSLWLCGDVTGLNVDLGGVQIPELAGSSIFWC